MRHHYVPQFLMRAWAETTADGRVLVYRRDIRGFPSSWRGLKHTGFDLDLWKLSLPAGSQLDPQALERVMFQRIDDLAAPIRAKMATGLLSSLTARERLDWTYFLMSLRLRQPHVVTQLKSEAIATLKEKLAADPQDYRELAKASDPPTLEEWAEQHFPGLIENIGLRQLPALVSDEGTRNKIYELRWWVWNLERQSHHLLLADQPCILTGGLHDPDLIIALPISPTRAFFATNDNRVSEILERVDPKALLMRLNESTVANARIRIYARSDASGRFIRNRWSRLTGPVI